MQKDGDLVKNMVKANELVKASGKPNFQQCKIQVPSGLNLQFWEQNRQECGDENLVEFMRYGFPISFEGKQIPDRQCNNHKGARLFDKEIDSYLAEEVRLGAILGPFKKPPFKGNLVISPLNSCPKKDSAERRIIADMSYPKMSPEASINGGIDKYHYLGEKISLRYPSVDNLVQVIREKGNGCALFKRDLKRAYRQFPVDPGDLNLLGYSWKGQLYVDRMLVMGLRSAAYVCQRVTNAAAMLAKRQGIQIINYLDDFAGAETWEHADAAFDKLGKLLEDGGLQESSNKACRPNTRMVFLGIMVDTVSMTLEVSPDRLRELNILLDQWLTKETVTRKEIESMIGVLQFVTTCVRPGRIFLARLLNVLRETPIAGVSQVSEELRRDLRWWKKFLPYYNGISMIPEPNWSAPDAVISSDACLEGGGGWFEGKYFHVRFPLFLKEAKVHINGLELITLIVALKVWGKYLKRKKVTMLCDNLSSVVVTQTGKARDPFLQACLRELLFVQAKGEFEVRVQHIRSAENRISDLLSRWYLNDSYRREFFQRLGDEKLEETFVFEGLFHFSHPW